MTAETKPGREPEAMVLVPSEPTEAMVAAGVKQSTAYPIVPPGYQGRVEPIHPFAMRVCLKAAIAASPAVPAPAGNGVREALAPFAKAYDECVRMRRDDGLSPPSDTDLISYIQPGGGLVQFNPPIEAFRRAKEALANPVSAEEDGLRLVAWMHPHNGRTSQHRDDIAMCCHKGGPGPIPLYAALTSTPAESAKPDMSAADREALELQWGKRTPEGSWIASPQRSVIERCGAHFEGNIVPVHVKEDSDGELTITPVTIQPAESAPSGDTVAVADVDTQVLTAAREMSDKIKKNPEWLWYDHDHGPGDHPLSFGRWAGTPSQAPYIRADLVVSTIEALQRERDAAETVANRWREHYKRVVRDKAKDRETAGAFEEQQEARIAELEASLAQERKRADEASADYFEMTVEEYVEFRAALATSRAARAARGEQT